MNPFSRVLVGGIRAYQVISSVRPPRCRFLPTCSAYATEAITVHGPLRGFWYAVRRLGKCHPFGSDGVDPVPAPRSALREDAACEGIV